MHSGHRMVIGSVSADGRNFLNYKSDDPLSSVWSDPVSLSITPAANSGSVEAGKLSRSLRAIGNWAPCSAAANNFCWAFDLAGIDRSLLHNQCEREARQALRNQAVARRRAGIPVP